MLIPMSKLELLNKAVKTTKGAKDKLPEGGLWRTIKGHKVYIKDGEILAGHVPGVTDTKDFKKLVKKPAGKKPVPKAAAKDKKEPAAAKKTTKKASEVKKEEAKLAKKTAKKPVPKATTKAEEEAAKTRKEIDALAGNNAKAEAKIKKKTVKEAMKESKAAIDEAIKKPNPKNKQGKSATKADLDKVVKDTEAAKAKEKKGKGATKADLDALAADNAKRKPVPKPVTKEDLDEMFGLPKSEEKSKKPTKKAAKKDDVAVIRSEKQTNNEISYDVGKKIGGARKDIAAQQKAIENLMGRKSGQSLEELEAISPETAQKYCIKKNLLPPMDNGYFTDEYKSGTDVNVAVLKASIYDRIIPKPAGDTPEDRRQYLNAIQSIRRALDPIKNWDEFKEATKNLGNIMKMENPRYIKDHESYIEHAKKKLEEDNPMQYELTRYDRATRTEVPITKEEWRQSKRNLIKEYEDRIKAAKTALKSPYSPLGEKFMNFFTDYESRNRTIDRVAAKRLNWDDYLTSEAKKKMAGGKKKISSKQKWEKIMPEVIQRKGGRTSKVEKPEDMIKNFGFSGVEFGNWVDDSSGNFHMKKCAEAFMDLSDIIGINDKDVSFNGKLSMAFGARGQGGALAHYEPASKAINITKEGGAGSLAHEWGHAMDNILYQASVGHSSLNFGADGLGDIGSPEVKAAYKDLMHAIMFGEGMGKDMVPNEHKKYYSYPRSYMEAYQKLGLNGAIKKLSEDITKKAEDRLEYYNGYVRKNYGDDTADKNLAKVEKAKKRDLKDMIQVIAFLHEKATGESPEEVPAYTGHSQYYVDSSKQAKSNDYWTSNREMFARAFENYIEGKMRAGKIKNDYLVYGTYATVPGLAAPYPQGTERDKIHQCFDKLMEAVRKSGDIKKGLSYDLVKDFFNIQDLEARVNQRNRNAYNVADTSEVFFIPINRLKCEYQTEKALNFDKIRENVERMKLGENLEPVVIGYDYDVHDGHHRIEASKIMKYTHVPCVVGGSNDIEVQKAKDAYSEVWKSIILEALDPNQFPYEATEHMFRGIGQKELDFIEKEGYIQSKGKGNDGDQGVAVTCFSSLFSQAEGYARSQYDLYHEPRAYVIAVERPLAAQENELGEIEVAGKIPADMIHGILPITIEAVGLHKSLENDVEDIDLAGEKKAILDYSERIKGISDPKVKKVIAEILADEKTHKHNLKQILKYLNGDKTALDEDKLEKSMDKLPEGGEWKTVNGHHVYIKDGKVLAGNIPGISSAHKTSTVHSMTSEGSQSAPKSPSEDVHNSEKRMYTNNERGADKSDPQKLKGVSNMSKKGASKNERENSGAVKGNTEEARQNERGNSGGNGEGRLEQGRSGASSKGVHVEYSEVKDSKVFHNAIANAKKNNDHGAFVDLHDLDDYKNDKLLMSPNGGAGVAITPDGNIISVFKDPASKEQGAMHSIMMNAIQNGGNKLDCFNGFLPKMYSKYGMVPVAKLKFNREYAPEGWNFERDGEPDVIFMAHNGDSFEDVQNKFGEYPSVDLNKVPYVNEYDDGIKAQTEFLTKRRARKEAAATN